MLAACPQPLWLTAERMAGALSSFRDEPVDRQLQLSLVCSRGARYPAGAGRVPWVPMLVVVACTESKTLAPSPERQLRNYSRDSGDLVERWHAALRADGPRIAAKDLYKGGYWTAVRAAADVVGWSTVSIVSAGRGLVRPYDEVSAYSATFSAGHADSIPGAGGAAASAAWWSGLGGDKRLMALIEREKPDGLLCALPASYLRPLEPVLERACGEFSPARIVILGEPKSSILKSFAVPVDARAVRRVGGAAGQLAARVLAWAAQAGTFEGAWDVRKIRDVVRELVHEGDPRLYPSRAPMTDTEIRVWIGGCLDSPAPPTSASTALRSLRDSGRACEEKRFRVLFREVSGERAGTA